jgi:predicted amidohydrolase
MEIAQLSPDINLDKAESLIQKAVSQECHIITFPEDFVTGPIGGNKDYVDFESKYVRYFQELAKKYGIDIAAGSIIEGDAEGWYNTAYYIDSSGAILGKYRKVHLWDPEVAYLQPGGSVCVFDTKYGKASLSICFDIVFPELFRIMEMQNVEIIFCPSYWTEWHELGVLKYNQMPTSEFINSLAVARSIENCAVFVYTNAAGTVSFGNEKETLVGHSQVAVPFIGSHAKLQHNREELLVCDIDTNLLNEARQAYKLRDGLKQDAHLRLKRVLDSTF